jgi:hypothetical protein
MRACKLDRLSIFQEVVERAFENHEPRLHRHHALDDAKANMLVYLAWKAAPEKLLGNPK